MFLKNLWTEILIKPLVNLLLILNYFTGSFGLALILLTFIIKLILVPLNIPQLKMQSKRLELQDELKKLNEKYKDDKTELSKKQMELYKKHGVNPAGGCLPMLVQIFVFIALYRVFMSSLSNGFDYNLVYFDFLRNVSINTQFLWLNLTQKDPYYILPALAALSQFLLSKTMMPQAKADEKLAKQTEKKSDDFMTSMQEQMLYIAPVMTFVIGLNLPSGLVLYWFISTLFSYVQNLLVKKYVLKN